MGHLCLLIFEQRLMGASLLVFANKKDVSGCMTDEELQKVCIYSSYSTRSTEMIRRYG